MSRILVPAVLGLAVLGFAPSSKAQVVVGIGNPYGLGYGGLGYGGLGYGYAPGVSYYNSGFYGYRAPIAPYAYRPYGYGYGPRPYAYRGYGYRGYGGGFRRGYRW